MIPKKIHYCWFGGKPLTKLAKDCINSWKKYCPDYEIIEWNETNFNISLNTYVKEAYECKKWAFVSDVARLFALYNYGGIYMDTDVELKKNIDVFLKNEAFSGFESDDKVSTALMGSEKHNKTIKIFLDYYSDKTFVNKDGSYNYVTNVIIITNILKEQGLIMNNKYQKLTGFALYPSDYFCPLDFKTKKINCTSNTYAIHWFNGSWIPLNTKIKLGLYNILEKAFGKVALKKITNRLKGNQHE